VTFVALDRGEQFNAKPQAHYPLNGELVLHKAIYNRVVAQFNGGRPLSLRITTNCDDPASSDRGVGHSRPEAIADLCALSPEHLLQRERTRRMPAGGSARLFSADEDGCDRARKFFCGTRRVS
jgi:hypothetical protein